MTKTLTEQWREGTLSMGYYYVSTPPSYGWEAIKYLDDDCSFGLGEDIIQEVLAPVPSYDEWKQAKENLEKNGTWYTERSYKLIEKKLEIATNALKRIDQPNINFEDYNNRAIELWEIAYKALKEMEGVK